MTTPGQNRRPDGHQRYLVRRVIAVALAVIAIVIAAGAGVWLQKSTGWSIDYLGRKARYGFVTENTEHESAVAIPTQSAPPPGTSNDRTPNEGGQNEHGGGDGGDGAESAGGGLPEAPASATHPTPVMRNTQHSTPLRKAPKPGDNGVVKLKSAGLNRQMVLRVPSGAVPRQSKARRPKPLIIAFHGYNQSGDAMARFADLGREGAIVAYPDGKGKAWAGAPYSETSSKQDFALVRDIINRTAATYQVDDLRIYAAGMSNGGGFVAKLACEMPYEFAAFASVAGAYYPGTWQGCAKPSQRKSTHPTFSSGRTASFLEIHGEQDERIDYDGGSRYGERYLSAMSMTGAYAYRAQCFGAPAIRNITPVVRRYQWRDCADEQDIMHVAVKTMGHTWPGEGEEARPGESGVTESRNDGFRAEAGPTRAVNGGAEILSFFNRHIK